MARRLRKGSKVYVQASYHGGKAKGVVVKKYTARKGSVSGTNKQRTIVQVRARGNLYIKRPSELRRRK